MLQGGAPSPFDRNFGTKLGVRAIQWISEKLTENFRDGTVLSKSVAAVKTSHELQRSHDNSFLFPARPRVCQLTGHGMCTWPQQKSHLVHPHHWAKGCDRFWVSKFRLFLSNNKSFLIATNNDYSCQAPNAQGPVVVQPSAHAKNVGKVPNQLLWICSRRDGTCDPTFHQHRLWVLEYLYIISGFLTLIVSVHRLEPHRLNSAALCLQDQRLSVAFISMCCQSLIHHSI